MTSAALDPPALEEGSTFAGRFRIERRARAEGVLGGRSVVWEVVALEGERVSERHLLVVWPPAAIGDEAVRGRFVDAVAHATAVESASVVRVLAGGVDEATGAPWIAKELFRGEPVTELVRVQSRLDLATTRVVLQSVAEAMGAGHARDEHLRELFAEDVLILREPSGAFTSKLELGAAWVVAALGERSVAETTLRWLAPDAGVHGTRTADVWSYGMFAAWVLGASSGANAAGPPPGFALWLSGATAREPSLRFLSIGDAWSPLEPVLEGRGQASFDAPRAPPPPVPGASRVSWVLAAVIFGSLAFVIVVGGFVFGEPPPPRSPEPVRLGALPPAASAASSASVLAYDPLPPLVASTGAAPSADPPPPPDPVAAQLDGCLAQGDLPCIRRTLEPAVFASRATPAQAQMLYDLCELDRDDACRTKVASRYATIDSSPSRRIDLPVGQPTGRFGDRRGLPGSVAPRAKTLLAKGDAMGARALLGPRVFGKIATTEEVRLLLDACDRLHDNPCRDDVSALYPGVKF